MHVISRKALKDFWEKHPDSQQALSRWYKIISRSDYQNLAALKTTFPTADLVGRFVVFNIGGNKYRLVTSIHFNRGKIYIRHIITHADYDKGAWKK